MDIKHKDFKSTQNESLNLDKQGKVCLGTLKDIISVKARYNTTSEYWKIDSNDIDTWTQSSEMHIIEGETIEIPVNIEKDH